MGKGEWLWEPGPWSSTGGAKLLRFPSAAVHSGQAVDQKAQDGAWVWWELGRVGARKRTALG